MIASNLPTGETSPSRTRCSARLRVAAASIMAVVGLCCAAQAASLTLELEGEAERTRVDYACRAAEGAEPRPLTVEYINLPGNTLALLPVEGRPTLFVSTVSASGAKYVAGGMVWWTKGPRGDLYDERTGDPSGNVVCEVDRSAG